MSDGAAVRGFLVPLAMLFAAALLWTRASFDRVLGPLDLGTASWLIAALWVVAPVLGGGLVADLATRDAGRAAAALGIAVGLAVAFFISVGARAAALTPDCAAVAESLPPSWTGAVAVGAIVGFGMAASEVVMATLTRRVSWLLGAAVAAAINFAAGAAAAQLLLRVVVCM